MRCSVSQVMLLHTARSAGREVYVRRRCGPDLGVEWEEVWFVRIGGEEKQRGMHVRSEVATTLNLHAGWLPAGSTSKDVCV